MALTATCKTCGKRHEVAAEFAGRSLRCGGCGGTMVAGEKPPASAVAPAPSPTPTPPFQSQTRPTISLSAKAPISAAAPAFRPQPEGQSIPYLSPAGSGVSRGRLIAGRTCLVLAIIQYLAGALMAVATFSSFVASLHGKSSTISSVFIVFGFLGAVMTTVTLVSATIYLLCGIKMRRGGIAWPIVALILTSLHLAASLLSTLSFSLGEPGLYAIQGDWKGFVFLAIDLLFVAAFAQLTYLLIQILRERRGIMATAPGAGWNAVMLGGLIGYVVASLAAGTFVLLLSVNADDRRPWGIICVVLLIGSTGAYVGHLAGSLWRKAGTDRDGSPAFVTSTGFWILLGAVLVASLGIGMGITVAGGWVHRTRTIAGGGPGERNLSLPPRFSVPPELGNRPFGPEIAQIKKPPIEAEAAAKLKDINAKWHSNAAGVNALASMHGGKNRPGENGSVMLQRGALITPQQYKAPLAIQIILRTKNSDLRIGGPANQIIFNWQMDRDDLRIDGGPANGKHKAGAGRLPDEEWAGIELIMQKDELVIYVDGKERHRIKADFSKVDAPIRIENHGNWDVEIQSVKIIGI